MEIKLPEKNTHWVINNKHDCSFLVFLDFMLLNLKALQRLSLLYSNVMLSRPGAAHRLGKWPAMRILVNRLRHMFTCHRWLGWSGIMNNLQGGGWGVLSMNLWLQMGKWPALRILVNSLRHLFTCRRWLGRSRIMNSLQGGRWGVLSMNLWLRMGMTLLSCSRLLSCLQSCLLTASLAFILDARLASLCTSSRQCLAVTIWTIYLVSLSCNRLGCSMLESQRGWLRGRSSHKCFGRMEISRISRWMSWVPEAV